MVVVLLWGYSALLRRLVRRRPVPAVLQLATLGLTIKTIIGLASGSTFAYFAQPIATTIAIGGVFLGSVVVGRPLIAHIAHDFCPVSTEVAERPAVAQLFVGLTVLWAVVQLLSAVTTFALLISVPVTVFAVVKPAASLATTAAAVTITVCWSLRTARREDLVFATA